MGVFLKHLFLMSPSGKGTGGGLRWDLNTHAGHGNYFARPYPSFPGPFDRLTALSNVEGLPGESRTYYSDRINRIDRIFFCLSG